MGDETLLETQESLEIFGRISSLFYHLPNRIEFDEVPGASPVKHNVDAFLDHSDDYKLDDVEAQLHKIHKEFIQFKECFFLIR